MARDPASGSGLVPLAISDLSGKSFPGAVPDAKLRGPAQAVNKSITPRVKVKALVFIAGKVKNVSLTGLTFKANPTVEMHGA
jgi:hypothetical protein